MMLTHTWIDQYSEKPIGKVLRDAVIESVQFDCGPVDFIPIGKGEEFCKARAPYQSTLLQFETPNNPGSTHALILYQENQDGTVTLTSAQRQNNQWATCNPTTVSRNPDGSFNYKRIAFALTDTQENEHGRFIQRMHGLALNLFYIIGCSNVEISNNNAPKFLNKKREKSGKFPLLEYKTLVLKTNAVQNARTDNGGSHASPRLHLRRGHIRRLDSERRVWVQACIVGSKHGMIIKDYKVSPTNH